MNQHEQMTTTTGDENIELERAQKRKDQLADYFEEKPFHVRWSVVKRIVYVLGWVFSIISGLGVFSVCFFGLSDLQLHIIAAGVLAVVAAVLWELLTRKVFTNIAKDFFRYGRVAASDMTVGVLIVLGSAGATFWGVQLAVPELRQDITRKDVNVEIAAAQGFYDDTFQS